MTVRLGIAFPLHAGSSSKVILAFVSDEEQRDYLTHAPLERLTDGTIVEVGQLRDELASIRLKGYARSTGERQPDAGSVAAPILDRHSSPIGSISVCGPAERVIERLEEFAPLVVASARHLSSAFGHK